MISQVGQQSRIAGGEMKSRSRAVKGQKGPFAAGQGLGMVPVRHLFSANLPRRTDVNFSFPTELRRGSGTD